MPRKEDEEKRVGYNLWANETVGGYPSWLKWRSSLLTRFDVRKLDPGADSFLCQFYTFRRQLQNGDITLENFQTIAGKLWEEYEKELNNPSIIKMVGYINEKTQRNTHKR